MKTRLLALLGLSMLLLAAPQAAQRGSKGSGPSHGSSGGSHASGQGSRGSSSPAPRPSGGGSSHSGGSVGGSSGGSVRPSAPPSVRPSSPPSVRPSAPPSVRPSPSPSSGTPSYPGARPSTGSPSSTTPPAVTPRSGADVYAGRARPTTPARPSSPDSAPTAGSAVEPPAVGAPSGSSGGSVAIPPARTQPRVRFPAPYSPAGTSTRSSGLVPAPFVPSSPKSGAPSSGKAGKPDSGPIVGYDRGPTRRVDLPRPLVEPAPHSGAPSTGKGGKGAVSAPKPKDSRSVEVPNWRDVRRSDPTTSKKVHDVNVVARRMHDLGVGAAAGSLGGVVPSGFRGHGSNSHGGSWTSDPCGWNTWHSCGWSWGWSWGWSGCGSWWWWSFPLYWSWYYPCWWWYTSPTYAVDYVYYPATTVVYAEPQVVYSSAAAESVGEGVVQAPAAGAAAPQAAQSPLAIAAQRYLELGDRAFREGRYFDAVQFYAKAVEFAPDQGALYLVLADALFAAGDYHYGAYAVRRALELDPALVDSRVDKHGFYPDPKTFDEQLAALERYLDANPSDRDARLVLALNYLLGARPKDAVRTLETALATMTEDAAAQKILERARAAQPR